MIECDVLVIGGGPAGSTCARALRHAGLDVVVMDRSQFPRDKVCAGWITPQVVSELRLDLDDYARGRTLQPITGFRTGIINTQRATTARVVNTRYDTPVSYGIRRCEFDDYLLRRSAARLVLGEPIVSIRRAEDGRWVVNDAISAPMLVGAAGHFCPVARMLNSESDPGTSVLPVVVAQEAEFEVTPEDARQFGVDPAVPELYFCGDMKGYGWCFRKQSYVNIGLGRLDRTSLPAATRGFLGFLEASGRIPHGLAPRWKGHAYLVNDVRRRRAVADGAILLGDAAGLAYAQSGEGIRPAIESGLIGAQAVLDARTQYSADRLASYEMGLRKRFGPRSAASAWSGLIPIPLVPAIAPLLLGSRAFVRNIAIDRWFLHRHQPALGES